MIFLVIFLSSIVIIILGVGVYGYLKGILSPPFDEEKMTLSYEEIGGGSAKMILLHGLTGSLNYWKRGLDKLKETHTLLLIDLLGFGDSPKPNSKYNLDEHLRALEKVISMEGFDNGKVLITGHSLGAILTLCLVAKHPDWFSGVTVIGLPVFKDKNELKKKFDTSSLWDGLRVDSRYKFICYFHPIYMHKWFKPKNLPHDVFCDAGKHTWVSYYNTLDNLVLKIDLYKLTKNIKDKKILFIHGENDTTASVENVKDFALTFNQSQLVILKNTGHQLFLKQAENVWKLIDDFYKN